MSSDLQSWQDAKFVVGNRGAEYKKYKIGCSVDKNPASCQLLGDFFEEVHADFKKAAEIFKNNCDKHSYPKSCFKYANYLYLGKVVKKDYKDSFQYYQKGCAAGDSESCVKGGLMCVANSKANKDVPRDYKLGMELLTKGCDQQNGFSCHFLAGIFKGGVKEIIEVDMKKAFEYSVRACDLGNMHACANVSEMYRKGGGVAEDLPKSEEYKKKALEMKANKNE